MHLKTSNPVSRRANRARPITVNFPIPKRAISKLRSLAIERDPRLVDLGVLAVQISDDESIVLGIELEKAKRKDLSISTDVSSTALAPRTKTPSRNVASRSSSCAKFYRNQFVTTTRDESLMGITKKPIQNAAIKKKAKESLNTARRSARGRGRASSGGQAAGAVARASTWEMVYTHMGLPGDHQRKSSHPPYMEPTIASKASGIANVPLAQPGLSRESTTGESTKKRESAVNSPPHKSPGNSGLYSEDESSVSSSPCSHSPMNQEELLNLFVDSNFSATSILKQLAESRVKEEEKKTDGHADSSGTTSELDQVWNTWHTGISPNTSCLEVKSPTSSSVNGAGLGCFTLSSSSTAPTTSSTDTCSTLPMKKTSALDGEPSAVDSSNHPSLPEKLPKRQKRSFAELEVKREMVDMSNKLFKLELEKSSQASATGTTTNQVSSQSEKPTSTTMTTTLPSTSNSAQNTALQNYNQYGFYYTSKDLRTLGSKALASKSLSKARSLCKATKSENTAQQQPSLCSYSGANTSSKPNNMLASQHLQNVCDAKSVYDSTLASSPTVLVNQVTSSLNHSSECSNDGIRDSKMENGKKSLKATENNECLSSNTDSDHVTSPSSQPNSSSADTKQPTTITSLASLSSLQSSSSTDTKPSDDLPSNSSSYRKGGQCYAMLSYVYPMGSVWYPYVAITPYAVLANNQNASEVNDKEQGKASNGPSSYSSTQYIDLASSLRYWQQLSLLYKNKLFASTTYTPNILTGSEKNGCPTTTSSLPNVITSSSALTSYKETSSSVCTLSESSNTKPSRRTSVIVTAKDMETYSNELNNQDDSNRLSMSTPESTTSSGSFGLDAVKAEVSVVIDNCDRLIEEQFHRMSEVFATASEESSSDTPKLGSNEAPTIPPLSFIPDSSIAYVNIGNHGGSKKSGSNGKENKGRSKRRKSTKSV